MFQLLLAVMIPLTFTAPFDTVGPDAHGRAILSALPVAAYEFVQIDAVGNSTPLIGYADSLGLEPLIPHKPGTRETVWFRLSSGLLASPIYVMSRDRNGNVSARSNGVTLDAPRYAALLGSKPSTVPLPASSRREHGR